MIDELKLIDNIGILLENKVVLYGAGYRGAETARKLKETGMPAAYFCDGDPQKWGSTVEGLEVLSLTDLKKLDATENLAIIIASDRVHFIDQIAEDIAWLKLRTGNIFTLFSLMGSLIHNDKASALFGGKYKLLQTLRADISSAAHAAIHMEQVLKWSERSDIVLVYSCPKVGSVTVWRSLLNLNTATDHLHFLSSPASKQIVGNNSIFSTLFRKRRHEIMDILKTRRSIKIITLVREPVARCLSAIMFNMFYFQFAFFDFPSDKLFCDAIAERITQHSTHPRDQLNWFDSEMKSIFGIDVYAYAFDREKGYTIIKQDNVQVLLMKMERLNSLEPVIAEFVGVPRFKLEKYNESESMPYKYLYKQVRRNIKIPRDIVDKYYNDPRMCHFYLDEEISDFYGRWEHTKS